MKIILSLLLCLIISTTIYAGGTTGQAGDWEDGIDYGGSGSAGDIDIIKKSERIYAGESSEWGLIIALFGEGSIWIFLAGSEGSVGDWGGPEVINDDILEYGGISGGGSSGEIGELDFNLSTDEYVTSSNIGGGGTGGGIGLKNRA